MPFHVDASHEQDSNFWIEGNPLNKDRVDSNIWTFKTIQSCLDSFWSLTCINHMHMCVCDKYYGVLVQHRGLSQIWLIGIHKISLENTLSTTYPICQGSTWWNSCISRARCDLGAGEAAIPVEACELRTPSGDVAESSGWRTFSPQFVLTTLSILWCGLGMMGLGGHLNSKSTFLGNMLESEINPPHLMDNV